jgi:23S rRNA (guanine745-N1)-methyltransferase
MLACPHCGDPLAAGEGAVRCEAGHAFDVARQGYVNLAPTGRPPRGDTAEMVTARAAFLAAGHYDALGDAVAEVAVAALRAGPPGGIVDMGAGTGWWLARVLDGAPDRAGIALDSSKPALRRAARSHPRIAAALCDAWQALPVVSGAAALALSVFAPRNGEEIARILAPRGALVVVTPTPRHLAELIGPLGLLTVGERKEERVEQALGERFTAAGAAREVDVTMSLGHEDAAALAGMGPSAHHVAADVLAQRVAGLPSPLAVTASVSVAVYRRARAGASA